MTEEAARGQVLLDIAACYPEEDGDAVGVGQGVAGWQAREL